MIYYSKEARDNATEKINKLYVKLAETSPTDQWTLQDIESVMYYLRTLKVAIASEQHAIDKKYGKSGH